jgi:anti-anti-sigma factor
MSEVPEPVTGNPQASIPRRFFMNETSPNPMSAATVSAGELTDLVRGNEQDLVARLTPLARRQSVTLDLSRVERIDAAGIAALITLHINAQAAGHRFAVSNLSPHVAEILALVGLEGILLSHNAIENSHCGLHFQRPAA